MVTDSQTHSSTKDLSCLFIKWHGLFSSPSSVAMHPCSITGCNHIIKLSWRENIIVLIMTQEVALFSFHYEWLACVVPVTNAWQFTDVKLHISFSFSWQYNSYICTEHPKFLHVLFKSTELSWWKLLQLKSQLFQSGLVACLPDFCQSDSRMEAMENTQR